MTSALLVSALPSLHLLAVLVGHVTLRLLKPECDLDQSWEEEDLDTAAQRTVQLLHSHTVPQREAKSSGEQKKKKIQTSPHSCTKSCVLSDLMHIWLVGNKTVKSPNKKEEGKIYRKYNRDEGCLVTAQFIQRVVTVRIQSCQ